MSNWLRVISLSALVSFGSSAFAGPVTYDVGPDGPIVPGFAASFLHETSGSGLFSMSCPCVEIKGQVSVDFNDLANATGEMSGNGKLYGKTGDWTLKVTGGNDQGVMGNGLAVLWALSYDLLFDGNAYSSGAFYFAKKDFNGAANPSPNSIDPGNRFILWGNNWKDIAGRAAIDRSQQFGIDLFGTAVVPEPGSIALMVVGLLLVGTLRRRAVAV